MTVVETVMATLRCGFAHANTAHALIAAHDARKLGERYDADGLELELELPARKVKFSASSLEPLVLAER